MIKGPVAKAGSILNLSKTIGTKVPNIDANTITVNNAALTVIVNANESLK